MVLSAETMLFLREYLLHRWLIWQNHVIPLALILWAKVSHIWVLVYKVRNLEACWLILLVLIVLESLYLHITHPSRCMVVTLRKLNAISLIRWVSLSLMTTFGFISSYLFVASWRTPWSLRFLTLWFITFNALIFANFRVFTFGFLVCCSDCSGCILVCPL